MLRLEKEKEEKNEKEEGKKGKLIKRRMDTTGSSQCVINIITSFNGNSSYDSY